jgi:hypothetical protein
MASTLRKWQDLDMSQVVFQEAKVNNNGGKNVDIGYVNLDGKTEKLWLQLPRMRIPFGPSSSAQFADRVSNPTFSLECQLSGMRVEDAVMVEFSKFMESFDQLVVSAAAQNSLNWFGKERSESTLRELFRPIIKEPRDMKYDPTVKVKLPKRHNQWNFMVYDQNQKVIDVDDLVPGNEVIPVVEMKNLWFIGAQFGTSMEARQLQCFVKEELKDFIIME